MFSVLFLCTACDDSYDLSDVAPDNDARVIKASIDVRYVDWKDQRTYYDHDTKVITVKMIADSFKSGKSADALIIYVSPTLWASMTPIGGEEEDWSSGQREYTITSGDKSVSNTYTIKLETVVSF